MDAGTFLIRNYQEFVSDCSQLVNHNVIGNCELFRNVWQDPIREQNELQSIYSVLILEKQKITFQSRQKSRKIHIITGCYQPHVMSIMDSCRSWSMIQWLGFPLEFIETVCTSVNSTFETDYWLNNAPFCTTRSHHVFYSNGSCNRSSNAIWWMESMNRY